MFGTAALRPEVAVSRRPTTQALVAAEQDLDPYGAQRETVRTTDDYLRERQTRKHDGSGES